jgi:TonB family protein
MIRASFWQSTFLLALMLHPSVFAAGSKPDANSENQGARSSAKAIYSPMPAYPPTLINRLAEGEGVYRLIVNEQNGEVTGASVVKSAGAREFDDAALKTLQRWRFAPHTGTSVLVPIQFSTPNQTSNQLREARKNAIFAPTPSYPTAARFENMQSWGIYQFIIDFETGRVTDVKVLQTSGSGKLDDPIVATFRKWLFYPHTMQTVTVRFGFQFNRQGKGSSGM